MHTNLDARLFRTIVLITSILLTACSTSKYKGPTSDEGSPGFAPVRAFDGSCIFHSSGKPQLAIGSALIGALAEPAIKVAFSTLKTAVRSAGEDKEVTIIAHAAFNSEKYDNNDGKLPKCIHFVAGSFLNSEAAFSKRYTAGASDYAQILREAFPADHHYFEADEGLQSYESVAARFFDNGIYLAGPPDLYVEVFVEPSVSKTSARFHATAVLYRRAFNRGGINPLSAFGSKDIAMTLQVSGPGESQGSAKGEVAEIPIQQISAGTFDIIEPGQVAGKPIQLDVSVDNADRIIEVTATETTDGSVFFAKVAEILDGVDPEKEQAVVNAILDRIDPERKAALQQQALADRRQDEDAALISRIELLEKRKSADDKRAAVLNPAPGSDVRVAAIVALQEMLQVNLLAQRSGAPNFQFTASEIDQMEKIAGGSGAPTNNAQGGPPVQDRRQ